MAEKKNPLDDISAKDKSRLSKAAVQVTAFGNFIRWANTFQQHELKPHPNKSSIMLFSTLQSGRFTYCIQDDELILGVQENEAVWLSLLPIELVTIDDRIYFTTVGVECMDIKIKPLTIGLLVDSKQKLNQMRDVSFLRCFAVKVAHGKVVEVGEEIKKPLYVSTGNIIKVISQFDDSRASENNYIDFL